MDLLRFSFWLLLGILFYSYFGYAVLMAAVSLFRKKRNFAASPEIPPLTLVIASYNEAEVLATKIENSLSLQYPPDKLQVLVVTDGSTDLSVALLKTYPRVMVLHQHQRQGKTAALNRAMQLVTTPVVVFSDANTLLNRESLLLLVRHFSDPAIGGVAGEKKVSASSGMGVAEGWYWKYESLLKRLDASFYTVVGAAGELFALRTHLYSPLPEDTILDDFALSLQVCLKGYKIAYEPRAFALEAPSASLGEEGRRKVRIASGAFQSLQRLPWQKVLANRALAFQFVSRRWLRWAVCPAGLILLLILNGALVLGGGGAIYGWLLGLQVGFYLLGLVGWWLIAYNKALPAVTLPFYFLFMNFCMLKGRFVFRQNRGTVLWPKAGRQQPFVPK